MSRFRIRHLGGSPRAAAGSRYPLCPERVRAHSNQATPLAAAAVPALPPPCPASSCPPSAHCRLVTTSSCTAELSPETSGASSASFFATLAPLQARVLRLARLACGAAGSFVFGRENPARPTLHSWFLSLLAFIPRVGFGSSLLGTCRPRRAPGERMARARSPQRTRKGRPLRQIACSPHLRSGLPRKLWFSSGLGSAVLSSVGSYF